jgi:hypothetical protein
LETYLFAPPCPSTSMFCFYFRKSNLLKEKEERRNGVRAAQSRPFKDFYVFLQIYLRGFNAVVVSFHIRLKNNIRQHRCTREGGWGAPHVPPKTPSKTWSKKHKNRYPLTRFSYNLKYPLQNIFSTSVHLCLTRSPSTQL